MQIHVYCDMTPESRDYGARGNRPLLVTAHQPVRTLVRMLRNLHCWNPLTSNGS
jgi:hypothetical protein